MFRNDGCYTRSSQYFFKAVAEQPKGRAVEGREGSGGGEGKGAVEEGRDEVEGKVIGGERREIGGGEGGRGREGRGGGVR